MKFIVAYDVYVGYSQCSHKFGDVINKETLINALSNAVAKGPYFSCCWSFSIKFIFALLHVIIPNNICSQNIKFAHVRYIYTHSNHGC